MSLKIERVNTPNRHADFLRLEKAVYAGDRYYVPATRPFPGDGAAWLVYDGTQPAAHCCARLQPAAPTIGTIGSFEALNHPDAVQALLAAATGWLKGQGARRVIGPMDGDTWHPYRFNTGPFDTPPFIKEPWNPPYYPSLWENAGFSVIETYDSFAIDDPARAAANQAKYYQRCIRNGYTFSTITTKNYRESLPVLYDLSCHIFAQNVLYSPIDSETFLRLYEPAQPLLKTGLSWLAYLPDRSPAGFVFTFPDIAAAIRAMRGENGLAAKLRFLLNRRKATRTCIKTLGVISEARGSGLSAALTYLSFENSRKLGFSQTLMCLMHSANDSRRFGGEADRLFRSYALYEYMK